MRDFIPPSPQYVERYNKVIESYLGRFTSPTFFSTTPEGKVSNPLPSHPPTLFTYKCPYKRTHLLLSHPPTHPPTQPKTARVWPCV